MGRSSGMENAPGAKPDRNDLLFGAVCMVVGVLAISLSWFAFRGGGAVPRANIPAGHSSNAENVGEVIPESVYRDGSRGSTHEVSR